MSSNLTNFELKTNRDSISKIQHFYKNKRKEIIQESHQKIKTSIQKQEKQKLREVKNYNLTKNNLKWSEELNELSTNWFYHLFINLKFFFAQKNLNFKYILTNWVFIRYVNKKKNFTASMAGEILWKKILTNVLKGIFLFIMAVIVIFPFYWMLSVSFRSSAEIDNGLNNSLSIWPKHWSLRAYKFLFNNPRAPLTLYQYIGNSFLIAILSTFTQITASLLAGYGLSYYNSRGKEVLIILMLAIMMLPGESLLIGQYIFASKMDMLNTLPVLFIPFIGNAFTIYMFKNAFDQVNPSIKKAAKLDGVSSFKFFWKVSIPLIKTTIFTALLISFISSWNAILWPSMVLKTDSEYVTLPLLLWEIMKSTGSIGGIWSIDGLIDPQNLKMAAAIVAILPMFILFIFTKKYLVKGITNNSGSKE